MSPLAVGAFPTSLQRRVARIRRVWWRFACSLTRAAPVPSAGAPEVHTLICRAHVAMALISMKSFDLAAGQAARFVFHDDGSLLSIDKWALERALPGCRVILRAEADARATRELGAFPTLREWRKQCFMAIKIVDFALWSEAPAVACIDSDILFFQNPEALLRALERPEGPAVFNKDLANTYSLPAEELSRALGVALLERANAGLWVMPRAALSLERMEEWARHPMVRPHLHNPDTEQAMAALLGSAGPGGAAHLPAGYDLSAAAIDENTVCRHYAGMLRAGFAEVGLPHLFGPLDFRARWGRFVRDAANQRRGSK